MTPNVGTGSLFAEWGVQFLGNFESNLSSFQKTVIVRNDESFRRKTDQIVDHLRKINGRCQEFSPR